MPASRLSRPRGSRRKAHANQSPASFVAPQLATLVSKPPLGDNWLHEIKFDGYRLLAVIDRAAQSAAHLFTRAGNDWTDRFSPLRRALAELRLDSAVIDGEAVSVGPQGSSSFHALQDALARGKLEHLKYYAFDLLHLNGEDLRSKTLSERKALLQAVMRYAPPILEYSQDFSEPGAQVLTHACTLGLEGIVSKRSDAPYVSGRSNAWLKSKCIKEQEFVIGGYTEQPKHPGVLGALLIGYYDQKILHFAGKVGTGFSADEGDALLKKLRKLGIKTASFDTVPTDARRRARFVDPVLVAHIKFGEWTPDGRLRHPSFQGLREDKPAREVVREKERSLDTVAKPKSGKRRNKPAGRSHDADR